MSVLRFVDGPRAGETIVIPQDFRFPLATPGESLRDGPMLYWPRDDVARDEIVLSVEPQPPSPEFARELNQWIDEHPDLTPPLSP